MVVFYRIHGEGNTIKDTSKDMSLILGYSRTHAHIEIVRINPVTYAAYCMCVRVFVCECV